MGLDMWAWRVRDTGTGRSVHQDAHRRHHGGARHHHRDVQCAGPAVGRVRRFRPRDSSAQSSESALGGRRFHSPGVPAAPFFKCMLGRRSTVTADRPGVVRRGLQVLFEGTALEDLHVQTLWTMVGAHEFMPKFPEGPNLAQETAVALLFEFPDLDISTFTDGGLAPPSDGYDVLTLLMDDQFLPFDAVGMNAFESAFRVALSSQLAALANVPGTLVDLTRVDVMGVQHEGQWWTTGVIIGARVLFPVDTLGSAASAPAFVALALGGMTGLFADGTPEGTLYGGKCLTLGLLNMGAWLLRPYTVVDIARVEVRLSASSANPSPSAPISETIVLTVFSMHSSMPRLAAAI